MRTGALSATGPATRVLVWERLRSAGYDEVRRIIREEEPPPPSAATRGSQRGRFRGELDWIVLKALDKDRERRYQSAGALATDVGRYLNDEPVAACPPSAAYRLRKWARRNKGPFAVALAAVVLVVIGVAALAVSNARTRTAQGRAEAAQHVAEERATQIRVELDRLKAANVLLDRGRWYSSRGRWDDADQSYTRAISLRPVKVGRNFGASMEALEGVGAKDQVVLNPPDSLNQGDKVIVAAPEPEKKKAAAGKPSAAKAK